MITRTKVLLGLGVAGLVIGTLLSTDLIVKAPIAAISYVVLPLGAIFFGLFLVSRMLEKESVFHDEEKHSAIAAADKESAAGHPASLSSPSPD
jgi:hypothetical protein